MTGTSGRAVLNCPKNLRPTSGQNFFMMLKPRVSRRVLAHFSAAEVVTRKHFTRPSLPAMRWPQDVQSLLPLLLTVLAEYGR
jgi:hypothetical protein